MSARRERFRHIVETLGRHGLGFAAGGLHLERLHLPGRPGGLAGARMPAPERVRLALEELGTVFIKFGQIVSTRTDILPPDYAAELATLQDASPAIPAEQIRDVIAEELGPAAHQLLAGLRDTPLATGSIGQAHEATLAGGGAADGGVLADVVVKVRRPGVVEEVNEDLEIMAELAKRAEQASSAVAGWRVAALVDEFAQTLRAELDYLQEARNAEQFAANFAGDPRVHIPRVFWDATTTRVLTLERLRGIKISDVGGLRAAGIDTGDLAVRACTVLLKMVFEDGFFHADPHPGNFFVEPDGRLGIIDFGMVGRIDDGARWNLVRVLLAVVDKDPRSLTTAVVRLCGGADGDYGTLQAALGRLLDRYADRPLAEVPLVPVLAELAGLLRTSRLRLPRETALMVKMLVMADGLGKQLDPGFELTEQLGPFTRGVVLSSLTPEAVAERLKKLGWEALRFGIEAPELARRLLEVLERGGVDVHFRAGELQALMDRAEKTGNRIVAGLIVAALIGAVGELVSFQPDRWKRWPKALFTAGLGGVGALGGYLAIGSRPHRRRGTG